MNKKPTSTFREWKARVMRQLSQVYASASDPAVRADLQTVIETLWHAKARDASTVIYHLHRLLAKHGIKEIAELLAEMPLKEAPQGR